MATEVLNDVYMVEGPIGGQRASGSVGSTLLYLIREEEGFVLVDAGWAAEPSLVALESQLRGMGVRFTAEAMAHVRFLVEQGLAYEVRENGVARYETVP